MEKAESFVGNYDLLITTDCGITNYNEKKCTLIEF
jgi:hypothetical protein